VRGLNELKKEVDAFIIIPNDKLLAIADANMSAKAAFALCDEILRQAVEGVSDIIRTPGDVNTDFNDIKAIMEGAGPALMGIGVAEGDDRAKEAAKRAVNSPLLDVSIAGAKGVLFVVAGSDDLGIMEVQEAAKVVNESVDKNAKVIFGMMKDDKLKKGQIRIIVIATGFPEGLSAVSTALPEHSLFSMQAPKQKEERGRIYHETIKKDEEEEEKKPAAKIEREEPMVTATPNKRDIAAPKPPVVEDEETWGAIPAFLRRHKK
jgi:cell division protein FtsZ